MTSDSAGIDQRTVDAYNSASSSYADRWAAQPEAEILHGYLRRHFVQGLTADVGCGSGRETAWLADNGYPAIGYDASKGLLKEARRRYPSLRFEHAVLPKLEGVKAASFDNVLCETVLMHLPVTMIPLAAQRLGEIVKPGGVLYLSWRTTSGTDVRDDRGRLYSSFEAALVNENLGPIELLDEIEAPSDSSGQFVHITVAKRLRWV